MTPTHFTGLDLHKRTLTATTLDAAGAVVATARMPCRPDALRAYFAQQPGDHAAAVECTTGWYWVRDALADDRLAVDLRLAHAKGVKAIAAAKVKTDAADSRMLAHLLRTDLLPSAHMISDEVRPLRDVLRTRLKLVERRVAAQNSIARLLEKHNVRDIADLDAFGQLQAEAHLQQIELLHAQVKRLEKTLHPHLVPDDDVQRLLRIPGIGKACAFSIRLEVDDISRFASDRSFFSYCRLVPGADNSGERARHKRSRDGNRYLKLAFSNAGVRAIQYYPEVKAWYQSKRRKKPEAIARALVAKEIARIAYHVLRKQEDFNGRFKGRVLSRTKKEQWPLLPSPAGITGPDADSGPRSPSVGMGGE
jgi:transposase